MLFTVGMGLVFLLTGLSFYAYTFFVQRRQSRLLYSAKRTNAIVSSLFPTTIKNQILQQTEPEVEPKSTIAKRKLVPWADIVPKKKLRNFLEAEPQAEEGAPNGAGVGASKPIAGKSTLFCWLRI